MNNELFDLLDRPIAFHRVFADISGSISAALFLSQALYWQRRCPEGRDGWWWKTAKDWTEETRLTIREQQQSRRILIEKSILEEIKKGIPCRLWYRVNLSKLLLAIKNAEKRQTGINKNQVCRNAQGKFTALREPSSPQHGGAITESSSKSSPKISSNKPTAFGGGKNAHAERLCFDNKFGLEFSQIFVNHIEESRACAIALKEGLSSEDVRRALAELAAEAIQGFHRDPVAAWVWLCRKQKSNGLGLSKYGEKNLPPWS